MAKIAWKAEKYRDSLLDRSPDTYEEKVGSLEDGIVVTRMHTTFNPIPHLMRHAETLDDIREAAVEWNAAHKDVSSPVKIWQERGVDQEARRHYRLPTSWLGQPILTIELPWGGLGEFIVRPPRKKRKKT